MAKKLGAYSQHLKSAADLETTYEQVRAGFIALALERNRRATPYVEEARALKAAASKASKPADLTKIKGIEAALLAAAGVSDKAAGHLLPENKQEAIHGLITKFLEPAGAAFVEELVFRFLLTRGDTLGGSMRNVGGAMAQRRITRALLATLTLTKVPYRWLHGNSNSWAAMTGDDADIELYLRGLAWRRGTKDRTLIYNVTVPLVNNNVDVVVLDCSPENYKNAYKEADSYVLLGEFKGGIDPAGADEHWKTARTALERIRKAFAKERAEPKTYFVGAAIVKKMAQEIWAELESGTLSNAANLTNQDQVASLCNWIAEL
jgi:type II restriction enzyme